MANIISEKKNKSSMPKGENYCDKKQDRSDEERYWKAMGKENPGGIIALWTVQQAKPFRYSILADSVSVFNYILAK